MEEAIYDRASFQRFLNIDLLSEIVPDETTILNFRHLLEKHNLQDKIFKKINRDLEEKGLLMSKGTIVDATLINSPRSTKNKDKARDPEMSSTKKNNQWYFGMKAHIGVDSKSGLVHSVEGTTAKVHDRTCLPALLHNKEDIVIGDKGYYSETDKSMAREAGINWAVLDRKKPGRDLSRKQKKKNAQISSVRSKVEHPFQVIKCIWGYVKTRYRGIKKNLSQLKMLFGLHNLYKVRKNPVFQNR
jgi:IS5 family transposase